MSRETRPGDLGWEEEEFDRLYGVPLNQFIEARNELARRYGEAGERARASRIKELVKPSVSAWIVNQLARQRELDVRRLVDAGAELEQVQRAAVEGKEMADFASARREEARMIQRLIEAAREIGTSSGHPPSSAVLQRVGSNLRAAAATEEGRKALTLGRLEKDLDPVGFEALSGVASGSLRTPRQGRRGPPADARGRVSDDSSSLKRARELKERLREAESEVRSLGEEWRELDREAKQAEQLAQKKRHAAEEAQSRVERAKERAERLRAQAAGHRHRT